MAEQGFGGSSIHETVCLCHPHLVLKSEGIPKELLLLCFHCNPKAGSNSRESKGKQAKSKASFFRVLLCGLPPEDVCKRYKVSRLTSNNPINKIPRQCLSAWVLSD